jgi:flagellar basal body rod protein FlgG
MGGIIELSGAILSRANSKAEISAQNIVNLNTIGYKARTSFAGVLALNSIESDTITSSIDFSPGKSISTGNAFDLSISGDGYFAIGSGDKTFYTRNGQFKLDADGNLATPDGLRLQVAGSNIDFSLDRLAIRPDGSITHGDEVVGRIPLVDFKDPSALTAIGNGRYVSAQAPRELDSPHIIQGTLEASNTSNASEMLSIMAAIRSAETGQRVVQLYDDMMAQAADGFGKG